MSFPKNFLFGSSTSSYQIEGAWNENGKGENIWDRFTHTGARYSPENTGDITCDSYHHYKEDVALMKSIGLQVYRFSISWSRILPNGEITQINEDGVNYYRSIITELLNNGIQPMVTIYHWDLPQRLQDMGGWMNPLIVDFVEDYADLLFKLFGDQVKWWITINEPLQIMWGYEGSYFAPGLNLGPSMRYIAGHNILRAHGRIFRLYDQKYRDTQKGKLSISISTRYFMPKTNSADDKNAAERSLVFELDWFAHPVFSQQGDYSPLIRRMVDESSKKEGRRRSKLPTFTPDEIAAIKGSYDFFALNYYTTLLSSSEPAPTKDKFFIFDHEDSDVRLYNNPNWKSGHASWLKVFPQGLTDTLRHVRNVYGNLSIFITENGYCSDGGLKDTERISYLKDHLTAVLDAMHKHDCQIIGYIVWSLLDCFEWGAGFEDRFGLVHVDFNDPKRKRTPKLSVEFYKELIKTHSIPKKFTDNS